MSVLSSAGEAVTPVGHATIPRATVGRVCLGLWRSARPEQWLKNLLVFAAPATRGAFEPGTLARAVVAFVAFTLAASGTYLVNDVVDRAADALHPAKRHRPIASGVVPPEVAVAAGVGLVGLALAVPVASGTGGLAVVVGAYVLASGAYNLRLKHVAVLELAVVTAFFVLRLRGGEVATGLDLPRPLLVALASTALALVAGKRFAELRDHGGGGRTRPVLRRYTLVRLQGIRHAAAGITVLAHVWWTLEALTVAPILLVSNVTVVIGIRRYAVVVAAGSGEQPERLVWADRPLLASIVITAVICGLVVPTLG